MILLAFLALVAAAPRQRRDAIWSGYHGGYGGHLGYAHGVAVAGPALGPASVAGPHIGSTMVAAPSIGPAKLSGSVAGPVHVSGAVAGSAVVTASVAGPAHVEGYDAGPLFLTKERVLQVSDTRARPTVTRDTRHSRELAATER